MLYNLKKDETSHQTTISHWFELMSNAEIGDWFEGIGEITTPEQLERVQRVGAAAFRAWHGDGPYSET